jgi:hypothetical protein
VNRITIIKSTNPDTVCKRYTAGPNGLEKSVVAHVTEGVGKGFDVPDARAMVRVLEHVTSARNLVLVSGAWKNDSGQPFRVVDERKLADILKGEVGRVPGGVIEHKGELISARLKRGIEASAWILLDADNPPGIPAEWAAMSIGQRLELWDKIIPGISRAERVELRGSSARVLNGSGHKPKTHAWVRVNKPANIGLMKAWIGVEMVNRGLSFQFEKKSRVTPDKTVGIEARSVFDLAVFDTGRIVFCSEPEIDAPGYTLDDAGIEIVNEGGGEVDISWMTTPNRSALNEYKARTGIELDVKVKDDGYLSVSAQGLLRHDTEITVRGETKTLDEWVAGMKPGDKLRCESPFRESHSEAALIRLLDDGMPLVHDVGNGTTYTLLPEAIVFPTSGGQEGNASNGGHQIGVLSFVDLINDHQPDEPDYIGPDFLGQGNFCLIAGPPKAQKSFLLTEMLVACATGGTFLGGKFTVPRPLKVFYLQAEMNKKLLKRRAKMMSFLSPEEKRLLHANLAVTERLTIRLDMPGVADVIHAIKARFPEGGPDIIAIDPLANLFDGESEDKAPEVMQFLTQRLEPIRRAVNPLAAIVLVHHSAKRNTEDMARDPFVAIRGSSALRGYYDTGVVIYRKSEEGPERGVHFELRNGESPEPLTVKLSSVGRLMPVDETAGGITRSVAISMLNEIDRRWKDGKPLSNIPQTRREGRYAPLVFSRQYEVPAKAVETLIDDWMMNGICEMAEANKHSKQKGIRKLMNLD